MEKKNKSLQEKDRLKKIASWYNPQSKERMVENFHLDYLIKLMLPSLKGPKVLEMSCSTGVMTQRLVKKFPDITVIDGSEKFIEYTKKLVKAKGARFIASLFEDFESEEEFDDIIMSHVLEHVENPPLILKKAKGWLKTKGRIHIMVPNSHSLHRRIGQKMGIIKRLEDVTAHDISLGHRRVYNAITLKNDVKKAGLAVASKQTFFLKPLSASQMQNWDKKLLSAFFEMGKELPDYCATLYFVCQKK